MTVTAIIRLVAAGVLLVFVYDETGPVTTLMLALCVIALEGLAHVIRSEIGPGVTYSRRGSNTFHPDFPRYTKEMNKPEPPSKRGVRVSLANDSADGSLARMWEKRRKPWLIP